MLGSNTDSTIMAHYVNHQEQVLDRQDTHEEHHLLAAVKGVARQHAHLGWISEFPRRRKTFKMFIKKVMRWKRHSRWKNVPTTNSYRKQKLLKFFNGYCRISDIFAFLILVAAIWICSHSEQFEPLVPELNQDYTLRDWCFREVIQCKVFIDHVQMTALVTALGVPLRVECLLEGVSQDLYTGQDDSQEDTTRNTCWPHHHRQLPHGHVPPHVTVLYMNAHYDIIYPHRRDDHVPSIDESCSQKTAEVQRPSAESSKSTNCPGT
ncbi:hypothetical protein BS78_04G145800 [Paspalum vaginatum]|nr:hypothetical protein BS78_04G145800 [Paspalum vaginatum]